MIISANHRYKCRANRVDTEIRDAIKHQESESFTVSRIEDYKICVIFNVEEDSIYSGIKIVFYISYPIEYPFVPPTIIFAPPIFHPNVTDNGETFWFTRNWTPAYTLRRVIKQIRYLLDHPEQEDLTIFPRESEVNEHKEQVMEEHKELIEENVFCENQVALDIWQNKELLRDIIYSYNV